MDVIPTISPLRDVFFHPIPYRRRGRDRKLLEISFARYSILGARFSLVRRNDH